MENIEILKKILTEQSEIDKERKKRQKSIIRRSSFIRQNSFIRQKSTSTMFFFMKCAREVEEPSITMSISKDS